MTMNRDEVAALVDGTYVKILIPVSGEDGDCIEHHLPAGAIGITSNPRWLGGKQGWGIDLLIVVPGQLDSDGDPCTIVNTFDEGDDDAFQLEVI